MNIDGVELQFTKYNCFSTIMYKTNYKGQPVAIKYNVDGSIKFINNYNINEDITSSNIPILLKSWIEKLIAIKTKR